ncbi:YdcH family protein [Vibrio sp. TBV020]|uniref:YdcH family protein n=1 Tax=Vibrio sp. TBV020 TaxID=3137398 RepID=UPI0038CDC0E0
MLGEDHSLIKEFPEHKDAINALARDNEDFARMMKDYNALDKEIRKLELRDSPISDEDMHKMKHDRAELKDILHAKIQSL